MVWWCWVYCESELYVVFMSYLVMSASYKEYKYLYVGSISFMMDNVWEMYFWWLR